MSDLDKKLEEILTPTSESIQGEWGAGERGHEAYVESGMREIAEEIKQAFVDADWMPHTVNRYAAIEDLPDHIMVFNDTMKTWDRLRVKDLQKEWHDRFFEEFDSLSTEVSLGGMTERGRAIEAAKRASGIE